LARATQAAKEICVVDDIDSVSRSEILSASLIASLFYQNNLFRRIQRQLVFSGRMAREDYSQQALLQDVGHQAGTYVRVEHEY